MRTDYLSSVVLFALSGSFIQAAIFDQPTATSMTNRVSGTTPSGLAWEYVSTGSALPIRSSGTQNGLPGPVAYFNVTTGQLQLDPKGWNISSFNFTYTAGTSNTSGSTPGPLVYASGTSPTSAVVSEATGVANQRTLPAGTWTLITCAPARLAGTVSLVRVPTLATSYSNGNGAGGTSPYAFSPGGNPVVPGWLNQPWSFPYAGDDAGSAGLVDSGSIAAGIIQSENWRVFGGSGNPNHNVLGYGNTRSIFQYSIDGVGGGQVGAVIPTTGGPPPPRFAYIDIGSGTLTQVDAGYPVLSGVLAFVKTGTGSLLLSQSNATTNPMEVSEGKLVLANTHALPNSPVSVASGATLGLGDGVTTSVAHLMLSANSTVDLSNGRLTIDSGLSATQAVDALRLGRGDGTWNGTAGITSSAVVADVSKGLRRSIGWSDNGDGSITVAYAAPGDGTLDGLVDIMDVAYFLVSRKFDSGQPATWLDGDYNYDGIVDILDLKDFLSSDLYDAGYYTRLTPQPAVVAVPEPSTLRGFGVGMSVIGVVTMRLKRSA